MTIITWSIVGEIPELRERTDNICMDNEDVKLFPPNCHYHYYNIKPQDGKQNIALFNDAR